MVKIIFQRMILLIKSNLKKLILCFGIINLFSIFNVNAATTNWQTISNITAQQYCQGAVVSSTDCEFAFYNSVLRVAAKPFSDTVSIGDGEGIGRGSYYKQFSYDSINKIDFRYRNSSNGVYIYDTSTNESAHKINRGIVYNNYRANNLYYIKDYHQTYPYHRSVWYYFPFEYDSDISYSNKLLVYRANYMIGELGIPYSITDDNSYPSEDPNYPEPSGSLEYYYYNYFDELKTLYNLNHGSQSVNGSISFIGDMAISFAKYFDMITDINESGMMQNDRQMYNFLSNYSMTWSIDGNYYNRQNTNGSFSVHENSTNYPFMELRSNGSTVASIPVSCVIVPMAYRYSYTSNNSTYYSDVVWSLQFFFVGLFPDNFSIPIDEVCAGFVFPYSLNTQTSYSFYETFDYVKTYHIVGDHNDFVGDSYESLVSSLRDTLGSIPFVGRIISDIIDVILNILNIILTIINFFSGLPSYYVSGLKLILFVFAVKVVIWFFRR